MSDLASPLPHSPFVIRREDMHARDTAAQIVERAQNRAEEIERDARHALQAEWSQAHETGLRDGRTEAARLLAEAASAVGQFFDDREAELTELAFAVAYRVIGTMTPNQQMIHAARTAIAEHRGAAHLCVRVAPSMADELRKALAESDMQGRVEVEADEHAPPGSCTLVHPRGRSSLGILDQFRALLNHMRDAS